MDSLHFGKNGNDRLAKVYTEQRARAQETATNNKTSYKRNKRTNYKHNKQSATKATKEPTTNTTKEPPTNNQNKK